MAEEMIGVCGYCYPGSYHPSNMLLIEDNPRLSHDFCKDCEGHHPGYEPTADCSDFKPRNPDVYKGQTWFCQGCGCGTKFLITLEKAQEMIQ